MSPGKVHNRFTEHRTSRPMLDVRLLREDPGAVRANLARRKDPEVTERIAVVVEADAAWRALLKDVESLRAERNRLGRAIGEAMKGGEKDEGARLKGQADTVAAKLEEAEAALADVKARRDRHLMRLPNLLHESVPEGASDEDNVTVRTWGEPVRPPFEPKPHGELLESLGLADFDRAGKVSGAGFVYLKGAIVLLDLALQRYALDRLVGAGYTPIAPPLMMRRAPYEGVTDLGDFESVMYKVEDEDEYLIATSEHPIGAMFQDEIIDEDDLPVKLAGVSACFRREIGAHGVDTRGLFRMHQFNKVEQFVFCEPDDSWTFHEELLANAEGFFQALELPYRVVNVCTGDIGTVAAKKYDIEAWSPRAGTYREVVSCSNCTDYQARRLNIRGGKAGGDKETVHTLNSTMVATSRALVMILENHQHEDGTVTVPEVLRPYVGGLERLGA